MWNHFDKECYNKLSKYLSVAHSDIYKAISKFQEEESDASLKYYRALNNEKVNVINDSILNNHRQMYRNDEISIDAYTKYIQSTLVNPAFDNSANSIAEPILIFPFPFTFKSL